MGNWLSSGGDITGKQLLAEYQGKLQELNDKVSGLLKVIHVMDTTADLLVTNLQMNFESTDQLSKDDHLQHYRKLAEKLLTYSKHDVLHQKDLAVSSLISLIDFIKQSIIENVKSIPVQFDKLSLELNKDDPKLLKSHTENQHISELFSKTENQAKEISMLKKKIIIFKDKETTFIEEEKLQREKYQSLEKSTEEETKAVQKQIDDMKLVNKGIQYKLEKASVYEKKNIDLTKTLEKLQDEHRSITAENETSIEKLKQVNTNLNEVKQELQQKIGRLTKEKKTLKKEQKEFILKLNQAREEKDEGLHSLREKYVQENETLETQNKKQKDEIRKLEKQILDLSAKHNEMEKEIQDIKNEKNETIVQYEDRFKGLQQNIGKSSEDKEKQIKMLKEEQRNTKERQTMLLQQMQNELAKEKDESQRYKKKMDEDYRQKCDTLERMQNEADELSNAILKYERDLSELSAGKTKLCENLQKSKEKVQNLETDLTEKEREIKSLKLKTIKKETEEQRQRQGYESQLKSLTDENEILQKSLASKKLNLKTMQQMVDKEKSEREQIRREKDERLHKIEKQLHETLENAHKESKAQRRTYEHQLKDKDKALKDKRTEIETLTMELGVERDNLKKCHDDIASMETEISGNVRNLNEYKENMSKMDKNQQQLSRRVETVQRELDRIKSRKNVPVQLYSQKRSELTKNVEEKFKQLLHNEFVSDRLELEFWDCARLSDIKANYPLLVICITVSRIGTDVANAIHGIPLTPNMAVMIFHHKDEHALPNQLSERVLTGKELQGIGGLFDMAYFSDKGIYQCEMNSSNTTSLVTFIKRVARDIGL